jgi:uncharacterized protein
MKNSFTKKLIIITIGILALGGSFGFFKWRHDQQDVTSIPKIVWKDYTYVYDEADLLSAETEQAVNRQLSSLYNSQKGQVIVLTVKSLKGQTIEAYANTVFEQNGIGDKNRDDGLLLLIAKDEKRVRLEVGQGLEGDLNDGKVGRILDDDFLPYRAKNDYDMAVSKTISAISGVLTGQAVIPDSPPSNEGQQTNANQDAETAPSNPLFILLIGGLIALLVIVMIATGHGDILLWILLMIFNNRGGGRGSGGGGFGGGSSGSGGGFGGGSSSGGGASR